MILIVLFVLFTGIGYGLSYYIHYLPHQININMGFKRLSYSSLDNIFISNLIISSR